MSFKLDFHSHILPETWPNLKDKFGYGGWVQMDHGCCEADHRCRMLRDSGEHFRTVNSNCWSPLERIKDMERTGVNVQLLSTVPVMFNYWAKDTDTLDVCRFLNDHIASVVAQHPRRFIGAATVPLQNPLLAAEELRRCVMDLGLKAVEIGSHVNEWNLDERALDPLYKCAEELRCPVFVHPWDMETGGRMAKYWLPWLVGMPAETTAAICSILFGGVLERFPNLKFCFSHGGGAFPYTIGRISHGFKVRPDLCATATSCPPSTFLGKIYADSLVHSEDALKLLVKVFGEDMVLLGSDYPFPLGENIPGELVQSAELSQKIKAKLMGENALKLLGLNTEYFI